MLVGKHPDLVHVDELEVRGRQAKVVIWTIGDGGGRGATAASRDSADRA
jgi:hypothetical protein